MIVALCMARNEAPIIGKVIDHLYANGVDEIIVEDGYSTDDTVDVCVDHGAHVLHAKDRAYRQAERMTDLAKFAALPGDWVLPFDADEFWYATEGGTIREALNRTHASKLYGRMFLHRDMEHRRRDPKPLPKVAFRYQPGVTLAGGNHDCSLPGGQWGVLDLREWQYRSFEHLLEKVDKTRELHANTPDLPAGFGSHMTRLAAMTDTELAAEWEAMQGGEWIYDPIPGGRPDDLRSA